jgi:hypothetical protein
LGQARRQARCGRDNGEAEAEAVVMPSERAVEEAAGRVETGTTMIMAAVGGGKE